MAAIWTKYGMTEFEYFHDPVTGEHRGTPPTTNGRALDQWEHHRATHVARCTVVTPAGPATDADEQWIQDTYGKSGDELADEAEKGYPIETIHPLPPRPDRGL